MSKLVPLKCTICGGILTRETLVCKHCGTGFVLSSSEFANFVHRTESHSETHGRFVTREELWHEPNQSLIESMTGNDIQFQLDDRVDRKFIRYLKSVAMKKAEVTYSRFMEYQASQTKMEQTFASHEIDEDSYDNKRKDLETAFNVWECRVREMLDGGRMTLDKISNYVHQGVENKSKGFGGITTSEGVRFHSIDAKPVGDSFVYMIGGCLKCKVRSGVFSSKETSKCFLAEIDYKTDEITSFKWEPCEAIDVQEYLARPLAVPSFA